jgi:aspartate/methionine/tyrosine aminotransferase
VKHEQPLERFPNFRSVPKTGVIFVMEKAAEHGYSYTDPKWANLGQGAPEAGPLPGAPNRLTHIEMNSILSEYSPVAGVNSVREAVAELYNKRYRQGKKSLYTAENVVIASGGRAGLTRIAASLGNINLGHFLPDYTAYEELLGLFRAFNPIPIPHDPHDSFMPTAARLRHEVIGKGLGAVLLSNPCNPTGQVVFGDELKQWVDVSRETNCAIIFDEFYSHYVYDEVGKGGCSLSAAAYVQNVEEEPIIITDGLTKNWRYPGLRLSWTLGPKDIIRRIASAGSFLDGGAAHPMQNAIIPLIRAEIADQEALAIQQEFQAKRDDMVKNLRELGFGIDKPPRSGFYCFASLAHMPKGLQDGMQFFLAGLKHKVITVPGEFFDVNPGQRRSHIPSRLRSYVRISFGPGRAELERGLNNLRALVESAR